MTSARPPGPRPAPAPSLVIAGLLSADLDAAREAAAVFGKAHGGVDIWGAPVPFDRTRYYEPEMGGGLSRLYCSCRDLAAPTALVQLKREAWQLEQQLRSADGRRRVNIDPGLLDLTKVVLASFKAGPQKLYLGHGVWADIVLYFADGAYQPLRWTFPDLRGGEHATFFGEARQRYRSTLRARRSD